MAQETAESVRASRIVAGSHAKMQHILEQIAKTLNLVHTSGASCESIATSEHIGTSALSIINFQMFDVSRLLSIIFTFCLMILVFIRVVFKINAKAHVFEQLPTYYKERLLLLYKRNLSTFVWQHTRCAAQVAIHSSQFLL